ncbi:fimbrial protein FimV [Rhodanobacter sp. B2A1Ga4]|uniref:FimV/HubP family polar landmark protein n=1 Tax=Rhodanobacter TaxID=75309 RepID=UPI000D349927|nr:MULTISPECIES: FimV/HubP family polar landmark protein [Rhodanobacter]MBQ4853301.1 fimbrial protein FimV [Rhodanobacter sp. B2A1Ga4]
MNRSLKLSMLIALALGSSQVMAVDLGQIQVKSTLGQPLLAEIPLHPDSPAELQGLTVQLASSEQFARAGIVGGRTSIPLHFSVGQAGAGQPVIRITSSTPVDDPFLDLLIEVNGKAGKSVREYAILLDPPNAPTATAAAVPAVSAPSQPAQPAKAPAAAPVAARPSPATPARAPVPKPKPAAPAVSNGHYGPVERGQTLSSIARSVTPAGVDAQQMMLALQQANPDAFYRSNINALKSGAVLRVPTSAEAQAMTIAAAAAEVRRQNSDWRAGVPGKPTVVADAATRATSSAAPASAPDTGDRLALVPAKEGSAAGIRGSGAGDKSSASLRQDLMRTRESLASLQQQGTDLKTRLKDLADINSKNERLLSLKDNEIAELQAKLAAARKAAGMPPAATTSTAKVAAATVPAAASRLETATATASTAAHAVAAPVAAHSAATAAPAAASSPASTPVSGASVVTTPIAATPAPAKPVEKPARLPSASTPAVEQPWYMQTWAWAAGAGAIVLLILLAMLGRRRKPGADAAKASSSLADRFGSPSAGQDLPGDDIDQDELLDQLAEHPDDIGLHLELVTLYYSRRDVEHFEAAAEAMHAHITDPQQDEWQDVLHMGEDLVPGHPLFDHHAEPAAHDDAEARGEFNIDDYADQNDAPAGVSSMPPLPPNGPKPVSEYNFNFDLTRAVAEPASRAAPTADDAAVVAPLASSKPAPAVPASNWHFDEEGGTPLPTGPGHELDEFNDDPVDTKLDLARAYIDMGDAEGARAMLGEVVKEGTQMQKDAAKRLLDSLH